MTESFNFKLKDKIEVHINNNGKNDFINIDEIYLKAPSKGERDITRSLKKKYIEAVIALPQSIKIDEAEKNFKSGEEEKFDAKAIKFVLYAVKDFDINKFYNLFSNLLSRVAYKDENLEQKITSSELDLLSEEDFENIVVTYLEFFFVTSWMNSLA